MTLLPKVKLKALVSFPATVLDGTGVDIVKSNGTYQFNLDFGDFSPPTVVSNLTNLNALLWDSSTGAYTLATAASLTGTGGGAPAGGSLPLMDSTAAAGVATPYSREDHVHPSDTSRATVAYVDAGLALKAPLISPALTGSPTAPTQAPLDNSTKIATTAYADAASTAAVAAAAAAVPILRGYLGGLTLSTAGASTSFATAAGMATNSTGVDLMTLPSAISKTTAAWVVGSGNGGLDTGAIAANTGYHVYLIKRPDTGVVDVAVSLSASAPTTGGAIPAAYTRFRRIGWIKTNGSSQWTAFTQVGDRFWWSVPVADASALAVGTARVLVTLSVPSGLNMDAIIAAGFINATAGTILWCGPTFVTDAAPVVPTLFSLMNGSTTAFNVPGSQQSITTDTSAQIAVRSSVAASQFNVSTQGWIDRRGRDA